MRRWLFRRLNGGRLLIAEGAVAKMESYKQIDRTMNEAGGIILGREIIESHDIVIDDATSPGPGDVRGRTRFIRSQNRCQRIVNDVWRESNGSIHYLGEWHTHPEDNPAPSQIDCTNWEMISRKAKYESMALFFLIIGISSTKAWEVSKTTHDIVEIYMEPQASN